MTIRFQKDINSQNAVRRYVQWVVYVINIVFNKVVICGVAGSAKIDYLCRM